MSLTAARPSCCRRRLALFLLARITGTMALRVFKAHTTLALLLRHQHGNDGAGLFPFGCVGARPVLELFLLSIMYPTIFRAGHPRAGRSDPKLFLVHRSGHRRRRHHCCCGWAAGGQLGMRIGFLMPLIAFAFSPFTARAGRSLKRRTRGGENRPVRLSVQTKRPTAIRGRFLLESKSVTHQPEISIVLAYCNVSPVREADGWRPRASEFHMRLNFRQHTSQRDPNFCLACL